MDRLAYFSECLKDFLNENNMSVKQLSENRNIAQSRIYDFINQLHAPSLDNAIKIADSFHCPLDYLFGFVAEYSPCAFQVTDTVENRVKTAMEKSKLSRYQLHKIMSVSEPQLSRWYHGTQKPTLVSLCSLTEALNCSLDFLAGRD